MCTLSENGKKMGSKLAAVAVLSMMLFAPVTLLQADQKKRLTRPPYTVEDRLLVHRLAENPSHRSHPVCQLVCCGYQEQEHIRTSPEKE